MKNLSFTVDKNLRIRSWNNDLKMLTGADAAHAVGKKYTEFFPRFIARDREAVAETLAKQRAVNLRQCRFNCLAHHRKADIRIAPVRDADGAANRVRIDLDPSDPCSVRRQMVDAQQLIAIGKIAASLAHGVRNPLNAIKGAVVYLRDRYTHEETLFEFTEILTAEISRLESFISRFLNTTSFENDVAPVDINELIRKIKAIISLQTYARHIRCDYFLEDVPRIRISAFHLEQAILNIINNAIEAMGSGGTLTIRTALRSSAPATCIALEISDTGAGLDPAAVGRLPGRKSRRSGRGFGLFIADELIKYYKGQLKISGEKGKGTTVTFLLPVLDGKNGGNP